MPDKSKLQKITEICNDGFDDIKAAIGKEFGGEIANDDWYMSNDLEFYEGKYAALACASIEWQEKPKESVLAWVRVDILNKGLAVPVGCHYYGEKDPLVYRWVDDDTFEIFYRDKWRRAQSIDWNFTDKLAKLEEVN